MRTFGFWIITVHEISGCWTVDEIDVITENISTVVAIVAGTTNIVALKPGV